MKTKPTIDMRSSQEISLDRIREMVWAALKDKGDQLWIRELYDTYLIYTDDNTGKMYRVGYAIIDDAIQLGSEIVEVEQKYVDVNSRQEATDSGLVMDCRIGMAKNVEGTEWDVTICNPGHTLTGWYITDDIIRAVAEEGIFEGVDVNLFELPGRAGHLPEPLFDIKQLLVRNKVGWIDKVRAVTGEGLKGILHFVDSAKWLGKNLLAAMENGERVYGLSFDCPVRATQEVIDGKTVLKIVKFFSADSVDIVTRAAAGGKFNRAVASAPAHTFEEDQMRDYMISLIREKRPDLLQGRDATTLTDQDIQGLARMAMEPKAADSAGGGDNGNFATKDDFRLFRCGTLLSDKLAESDLPAFAKKRVREQFDGRIFEPAELDTAIGAEKDYIAQMSAPAEGNGVAAGPSIRVGIDSLQKAQMGLDRLFGFRGEQMQQFARMERLDHEPKFMDMRSVQDFAEFDKIPAFKSIMEAYVFFGGDAEVTGRFHPKRAMMEIDSTTFTYALGNTMARRLIAAYNKIEYYENMIVSVKKSAKNFKTQEAVKVGGFPDIEDVDPESGDYHEIAAITDEEASYVVLQKGNLLTFSRKFLINDDISVATRILDALGISTRRTHARFCWTFLIDNSTCTDGTAIFTEAHGNLGSGALGYANAWTAYLALMKMTEKDSGEYIGILGGGDTKVNLWVPADLLSTAEDIANEPYYYSSNDLTAKTRNPCANRLVPRANPLLNGDATDWILTVPADIAEIIEMGYLFGNEEPEYFVADVPTGQFMLVADQIKHKVRHEYGGSPLDYVGAYKAVVAD